jgi:hypothetical protein
MKRLYISGPMTGLSQNNVHAFNAEAERLRLLDFDVANPAIIKEQPGFTWSDYMTHALAMLLACDGVVMLPGWEQSRGACLERLVAVELGVPVFLAADVTGGLAIAQNDGADAARALYRWARASARMSDAKDIEAARDTYLVYDAARAALLKAVEGGAV